MADHKPTRNPSDLSPEMKKVARLPTTARWSRLISPEWIHQKRAINFLGGYLANKRGNRKHAALIRMPTGTGKTGIMAILANYFSSLDIGTVVIVAPSEFLTDQISDALNVKFWETLKKRPPDGPKPCVKFLPSTLQRKLTEQGGKPAVYVCTTQTLYMLHRNMTRKDPDPNRTEWIDAYLELRSSANLVLVDEGHREPAKEWAKAVRDFKLPTILFTATPYRNDLRFFKVGPQKNYRHTFRFQEAVDANVIRNVVFKDDESFGSNGGRFVDILLDYFYGEFKSKKPERVKSPKVIIRCETFETLDKIRKLLKKKLRDRDKNDEVLGVHEQFAKDDPDDGKFHDVPTKNDATFWVHQFKLTEGLDNADFCLLAFFEPFANARGLVQQIGRVLRNPGLKEEQYAVVLSDPLHGLREQWQGYLNFEKSERSLVGPEEIVERFLKSLPDWFYAGGRYRYAADFKSNELVDEQLWNDIRLHKSANIYQLPATFEQEDFEALLENLSEAQEDQDMIQVRSLPIQNEGGLLGAILSWRIIQSEALAQGGFFNVAFVPSVLYAHDDFLFHSGPISLTRLDEDETLIKLSPSDMEKLLGDDPILKQVSLINCDLGNSAVRRKSLGARSIFEIAPGLNDHFHYVSTAIGTFMDGRVKRRRYLGLSKGRVTEAADTQIDVTYFKEWARALTRQLKITTPNIPAVFNRFARSVPSPPAAKAAHLLLDLVDFFDVYGERPEVFPDTFEAAVCDVESDGSFKCVVGERTIHGSVTYSTPKKGAKRFVLESESLNEYFEQRDSEAGSKAQSASAYFTHRGVMRIVTTDLQLYSDRFFYEPRIPLWGENRLDNLELLFGVEALANVATEKGKEGKVGSDTWQDKSVFRLIDQSTELYQLGELEPEILVCEDMGTEYSDFIVADRRHPRIALIHAKQCEGGLSAKDLHIVNSQVTKNLEFLNPTGSVGPERGDRWSELWKWKKEDSDRKGIKRIRRVPNRMSDDGKVVFNEIQKLIRRPSTEKEVWMVLGKGFSIKDLKDKLSDKPPYHVVHLAYLLQSCNANVSSVGAKLRIFTCP